MKLIDKIELEDQTEVEITIEFEDEYALKMSLPDEFWMTEKDAKNIIRFINSMLRILKTKQIHTHYLLL